MKLLLVVMVVALVVDEAAVVVMVVALVVDEAAGL